MDRDFTEEECIDNPAECRGPVGDYYSRLGTRMFRCERHADIAYALQAQIAQDYCNLEGVI